ncbi:tRNA(Ile)-lysidine synthase [compost metagenome]
MKTYVVAVSGGVDSVVLLDKLVKRGGARLIVAHFDHGIRVDSTDDARFVGELANRYGLAFETRREELGTGAGEALARERRYLFLRDIARRYDNAPIVTAHHADDVVETIAINVTRGTGWRGLAVLDSELIRPLLTIPKRALVEYARQHNLVWHEDSTNRDTVYLRNELRSRIAQRLSDEAIQQLHSLWWSQLKLKRAIDKEIDELLTAQGPDYSRHFLISVDTSSALELLRAICQREIGVSPTIPQRERALHAVKTLQPGKIFEVGDGVRLICQLRSFSIQKA